MISSEKEASLLETEVFNPLKFLQGEVKIEPQFVSCGIFLLIPEKPHMIKPISIIYKQPIIRIRALQDLRASKLGIK